MSMTPEHSKALDMTLEVMMSQLNISDEYEQLEKEGLLTEKSRTKIESEATNDEKVKAFVEHIKEAGDAKYGELKNYLAKRAEKRHRAEELEKNLKLVQKEYEADAQQWDIYEKKFHYFKCEHDSIDCYKYIPDEINILLIGKTGSGKSATGNTIIGTPEFDEDGSSESVTKTIQTHEIRELKFRLIVIDTPGLFDTAKDFKNEELVLEIAKTMIHFKGGIHLFLLVLSSSVRFTKEENETIKVIEKVLSKAVYKNCVLVLTNARAKFGAKASTSLREYVDKERKMRGKFAELLKHVDTRVVAVENIFDHPFFEKRHRHRLLCYLAQIIQENKGSVYSNEAFERAKQEVERREEERIRRLTREQNLTTMGTTLNDFLINSYLTMKSPEELERIEQTAQKELLYIMTTSGVKSLEYIENEDVVSYIKMFIEQNKGHILQTKSMKLQQRELERRRAENKKRQTMREIQKIIAPLVSSYLANKTRKELEDLRKSKHFSPDEMIEIQASIQRAGLKIASDEITKFVNDNYFKNPAEIDMNIQSKLSQEAVEEKMKQMEELKRQAILLKQAESKQRAEQQRREAMNLTIEIFNTKLVSFVQRKTDEELNQLTSDIRNENISMQSKLSALFVEVVGKEIEDNKIEFKEFIKTYIRQNSKYMMAVVKDIGIKREKDRQRQREEEKMRRESHLQNLVETFLNTVHDAVNVKGDNEINQLVDCLQFGKITEEWKQLVYHILEDQIENCDVSISEIYKKCITNNVQFLKTDLESILTRRELEREAQKKKRIADLRREALKKISNAISVELKSYLQSKTNGELRSLKEKIDKKEVPADIYNKVYAKLSTDEKQVLSEKEIDKEILKQIDARQDVIKTVIEEARCFPASAMVKCRKTVNSRICNVKVNDEILVYDKGGHLMYDKVYLISHANGVDNIRFIRLHTKTGKTLFLSPEHLLPVGHMGNKVAAKYVSLGDTLFTLQDDMLTPDSVTSISYELCRGAYCPMTMNGTIVVNDVAASCYTSFVPFCVAHFLLSPIRLLFRLLPLPIFDKFLPYDDTEGMPILLLKCRSLMTTCKLFAQYLTELKEFPSFF